MAGLLTKIGCPKGSRIYFDNLFTSTLLMRWLSEKEIGGTGTVQSNRVIAMPHPDPKTFDKDYERGSTVN